MVGLGVVHARVFEDFPVYLSRKLKNSKLVEEPRKKKLEKIPKFVTFPLLSR